MVNEKEGKVVIIETHLRVPNDYITIKDVTVESGVAEEFVVANIEPGVDIVEESPGVGFAKIKLNVRVPSRKNLLGDGDES